MRLKFGDPKSIAIRDKAIADNIFEKLKKQGLRCPSCGGKIDHYFDCDIIQEWIGINFDCDEDCPNGAMNTHVDLATPYFDFNGKVID